MSSQEEEEEGEQRRALYEQRSLRETLLKNKHLALEGNLSEIHDSRKHDTTILVWSVALKDEQKSVMFLNFSDLP